MVDAARVAAIMHCVVACACLCSRMWMGNLWWCDDNLVFVIAVRDLDCRFLNARHVFVIILYSAASGHDIHFPPFPCHFKINKGNKQSCDPQPLPRGVS